MANGFKLGTGSGKRMLAILLLVVAAFSPTRLHAEERRSTVARLQIQVMVMPTVIAAQPTGRPEMQPSQAPISFNLSSNNPQNGNYWTQKITMTDQNGGGHTAVLKTLTVVPE